MKRNIYSRTCQLFETHESSFNFNKYIYQKPLEAIGCHTLIQYLFHCLSLIVFVRRTLLWP